MGEKGGSWLTIQAASEYLRVSKDFIRALITEEGLPYYKVRHTLFIKREDIDALVESHRVV